MKNIVTSALLCILPQLAYGFGNQAPAQAVDAQITCSDGTTQLLNDLSLGGSTGFIVYVKPEKIKSQTNNEIMLEFDPHNNDTKKSLLSVKTILFKNKATTYIYQDEQRAKSDNGIKHKFHEVEIDGELFLIADGNKLHGKDAHKNPRTINLNIVEKITITSLYNKGEKVGEECKIPV